MNIIIKSDVSSDKVFVEWTEKDKEACLIGMLPMFRHDGFYARVIESQHQAIGHHTRVDTAEYTWAAAEIAAYLREEKGAA